MESQPQFWAQQEVQTEPPSLPSSPTEWGVHKANVQAENFLQLIQANYICPIFGRCSVCWSPSSVPGDPPYIYLRVIQDTVVSLMDRIVKEFIDVSAKDGESQEDELRIGSRILHDLQEVSCQPHSPPPKVGTLAQPPPAVGTSAKLPISSETTSSCPAATIQPCATTLIRCSMEFRSWNEEHVRNWAQINPGLIRSIIHITRSAKGPEMFSREACSPDKYFMSP
ncbi:hypothetical protein EDD22DRAFT_849100 [Suillus occidentalis]|nr:hypothetical protein EDD22DRAFT_849100 [Suillus occidentalis]